MGAIAAALGMGLAAGDADASALVAFVAANHVLVKGALFLTVGAFAARRVRPGVWTLLAVVLALSLAGLPLTGGALAKAASKPLFGDGVASILAAASSVGKRAPDAAFRCATPALVSIRRDGEPGAARPLLARRGARRDPAPLGPLSVRRRVRRRARARETLGRPLARARRRRPRARAGADRRPSAPHPEGDTVGAFEAAFDRRCAGPAVRPGRRHLRRWAPAGLALLAIALALVYRPPAPAEALPQARSRCAPADEGCNSYAPTRRSAHARKNASFGSRGPITGDGAETTLSAPHAPAQSTCRWPCINDDPFGERFEPPQEPLPLISAVPIRSEKAVDRHADIRSRDDGARLIHPGLRVRLRAPRSAVAPDRPNYAQRIGEREVGVRVRIENATPSPSSPSGGRISGKVLAPQRLQGERQAKPARSAKAAISGRRTLTSASGKRQRFAVAQTLKRRSPWTASRAESACYPLQRLHRTERQVETGGIRRDRRC